MGKNDAFKSFLRPLLFCLGTFVSFFLFVNPSFAAIIDSQTGWTNSYDFNFASYDGGGLLYKSMATTAIDAITFKAKAPLGATTVNLHPMIVNCATGGVIDYNNGNCSGAQTIIGDDALRNYNFTWAAPFTMSNQSANSNCYFFVAQTACAGWSYGTYQLAYTDTGGATTSHALQRVSVSGADSTTLSPYDPYFIMYEGIVAPTISFTHPLSDTEIDTKTFTFAWTGTKQSSTSAAMYMQFFPWRTGLWENATPSLSDISDKTLLWATLPGWYASTSIDMTQLLPDTLKNGTYSVQLKIEDNTWAQSDIATRTIYINISGNDADPANEIEVTKASILAQCDTYDTATKYLCKAAAWLFVPPQIIKDDLNKRVTALKTLPPISYGVALSNAITTTTATASETWTPIPAFLNTFTSWLWYILFALGCIKLTTHLFKA